ncbi:MAG: hypothetical protein WBO55_08710 [Rhizobiaceae bacterium]
MPKYVFAYHGGNPPSSPEEGKKIMAAWEKWFGSIGPHVADGGNPLGKSVTVSARGVKHDGGANPISGYSLINAADMDEAIRIAKGCPILDGGSVEIAEAMSM